MQDYHLSLEEYILFIKGFSIDNRYHFLNGTTKEIEVFYVKADAPSTTVAIPEKCLYQVSGNNTDGFIVTLWRKGI